MAFEQSPAEAWRGRTAATTTSLAPGCPPRRVGPLSLMSGRCAEFASPGSAHDLVVAFADETVRVSQAQRAIELLTGEWTVVRLVGFETTGPVRMVGVPIKYFPKQGFAAHHLLMQHFSRYDSLNRMVYVIFKALFDEAKNLNSTDGEDLAEAALRILKNAVFRRGGYMSMRGITICRIHEYIEWHIRDPALSPERIARALHCTPRHIHRAFEGEAETISSHILRRRLEKCGADLVNPALCDHLVTDIAFSWGFNNAAHFSRVFKRQFGCSPSSYRAQAFQQAPIAPSPTHSIVLSGLEMDLCNSNQP